MEARVCGKERPKTMYAHVNKKILKILKKRKLLLLFEKFSCHSGNYHLGGTKGLFSLIGTYF
jgi:hypothetical protein